MKIYRFPTLFLLILILVSIILLRLDIGNINFLVSLFVYSIVCLGVILLKVIISKITLIPWLITMIAVTIFYLFVKHEIFYDDDYKIIVLTFAFITGTVFLIVINEYVIAWLRKSSKVFFNALYFILIVISFFLLDRLIHPDKEIEKTHYECSVCPSDYTEKKILSYSWFNYYETHDIDSTITDPNCKHEWTSDPRIIEGGFIDL
ncbi:MAG: hypothetical protein HY811_06910 [Planctomycetes bacterium]|nr:hypothetical protein [Planctomycetota bacterium]